LGGGFVGFVIRPKPKKEISIKEIEERLSELNTAELVRLVERLKKSWEIPEQIQSSSENF
jgi:hypothetical protein